MIIVAAGTAETAGEVSLSGPEMGKLRWVS